MPPMSGAATLVPPKTIQPEACRLTGPKTDTPVAGSATAETSATVRLAQPGSDCQVGLAKTVLQPLPAPDQAVSVQPRVVGLSTRCVPPTAVTFGDDAGYWTPKPESPELTVMATPGWR